MAKNLDEYRCKLVSKILQSGSQEEVKRYFDAAIKGMKSHNVNGHIMVRFIDKVLFELESYSPMTQEPQQWSNIKMGRIYGLQLKDNIAPAAAV